MIGILIALQINNWNEKRKVQQNIAEIKTALEKELENNIKLITNRPVYLGYLLSDVLQSLKTTGQVKPTKDSIFNSHYNDAFSLFDTFIFEESTDNLDTFISYEKMLSPGKEKTITIAKELKKNDN